MLFYLDTNLLYILLNLLHPFSISLAFMSCIVSVVVCGRSRVGLDTCAQPPYLFFNNTPSSPDECAGRGPRVYIKVIVTGGGFVCELKPNKYRTVR